MLASKSTEMCFGFEATNVHMENINWNIINGKISK